MDFHIEIPVLHYLAELGECFQEKSTLMTSLLLYPKVFQKKDLMSAELILNNVILIFD